MYNENWRVRAACRTAPITANFFPTEDGRMRHVQIINRRGVKEAVRCCQSCPVRPRCIAFAEWHPGIEGIWGGFLFGRSGSGGRQRINLLRLL